MGGFDLVIAVIFIISIIIGIMRGFIREALSITSWILAIWLSMTYCTQAGDFIGQYISIPADGFRTAAGFALVFISTLFIFSILSFIITKIIVNGAIKGTDRALGVIFGVIRAIAVVVAIMLVARGMGFKNSDWWTNSLYIKHFEPTADYVEELLPESLRSSDEDLNPGDAKGDSLTETMIKGATDAVLERVTEGETEINTEE